ncbi:EamA-like transporter family [Pyrobaculum oguniense TE7]|uniref:EamA-like transporter family n=1 Tax=Pyrobaculum oguniense (strain DSM 13380 / JCM 10595 / TE7) TaxID=698757 RepID=H6Q693_PYROT|nr:EamA-like transporter family [Pyrobaculum oguniense TE7]
MLHIVLSTLSAVAYGVAPLIYRPALHCTSQFRAMSIFSLYSIFLGLLLPWKEINPVGVVEVVAAALLGGVAGSWLYVTSIKVGGASVGNISSSLYIALLPVVAGKYNLLPGALLVLMGLALASTRDSGSKRGALYGVLAAFVWTASINFYAAGVGVLGPGGSLFVRGLTVFLVTYLLGLGRGICRIGRLAAGGFVDTFLGFGAYTLAISYGDYVVATLIMSTYPLVTALLEKPFKWRRAAGAAVSTTGLVLVALSE